MDRPTHDADFLGFGLAEIPHLENAFRDISRIDGKDGTLFQPASVRATEKEANYPGIRVTLLGMLASGCLIAVRVWLAPQLSSRVSC